MRGLTELCFAGWGFFKTIDQLLLWLKQRYSDANHAFSLVPISLPDMMPTCLDDLDALACLQCGVCFQLPCRAVVHASEFV